MTSNTCKLVYVLDPMCSWCWAFRPAWEKIRKLLPDNMKVAYILGGLAADSDQPMPETLQENIRQIWRKIQRQVPGTEFNFAFWEQCEPRRSTYPACRAVIAARNQGDKYIEPMILAIQQAYYLHAENPSNETVLITLAKKIALNPVKFTIDLNAIETMHQLEYDINFSRKIGAQGFPSLLLEVNGAFQFVPVDYNDPSVVLRFLQEALTTSY